MRDVDIRLLRGDCREKHTIIPEAGVDLVLTDPPYGTMKGQGETYKKFWKRDKAFEWDDALDPADLFNISNRILRKNGRVVFFAQEPYTSDLIKGTIGNLPFSYRMVWIKDSFANALGVNKAPVSYFEDIVVFQKKHDTIRSHPEQDYLMDELNALGWNQKNVIELLGNQMASHYFTNGFQFSLPTLKDYKKLQSTGRFQRDYDILKKADTEWKHRNRSIFNLPKGMKYKSNVLEYPKDTDGFHPTQKPVALLEDIIRTFTNPGETVADLTMGSGSTAVACANTGRHFWGIEKTEEFFQVSQDRVGPLIWGDLM